MNIKVAAFTVSEKSINTLSTYNMKTELATVQISFGGVLFSSIFHNFHGCVDCERIIIFFNYALFFSGGLLNR